MWVERRPKFDNESEVQTGTLERKEGSGQSESNAASKTPQDKQNKHKLREKSGNHLKLGSEGYQKQLCVICYEVFSNKSLKTMKLRRHLKIRLSDNNNKLFQKEQKELKEISETLYCTDNSEAREAF
jgi:hypothetical protein